MEILKLNINADTNILSPKNETLLHMSFKNFDTMECLLSFKADPNIQVCRDLYYFYLN